MRQAQHPPSSEEWRRNNHLHWFGQGVERRSRLSGLWHTQGGSSQHVTLHCYAIWEAGHQFQFRCGRAGHDRGTRSEEDTSELQSQMRTSYAVFCLKKKKTTTKTKKKTKN